MVYEHQSNPQLLKDVAAACKALKKWYDAKGTAPKAYNKNCKGKDFETLLSRFREIMVGCLRAVKQEVPPYLKVGKATDPDASLKVEVKDILALLERLEDLPDVCENTANMITKHKIMSPDLVKSQTLLKKIVESILNPKA